MKDFGISIKGFHWDFRNPPLGRINVSSLGVLFFCHLLPSGPFPESVSPAQTVQSLLTSNVGRCLVWEDKETTLASDFFTWARLLCSVCLRWGRFVVEGHCMWTGGTKDGMTNDLWIGQSLLPLSYRFLRFISSTDSVLSVFYLLWH